MALTVQVDGSVVGGQPNTAMASWWNDYHDLLTGVMRDQDVTLRTDLLVRAIVGSPSAPNLALASGTNLGIGNYHYRVTFIKSGQAGETTGGSIAAITTTSGNQAVTLSSIPTWSQAGVSGRNIYRTAVGGSTYFLVHTINDNTTTSWTDTVTDGSLGSQQPPTHPTIGSLLVQDASSTTTAQLFTDGAIWFDTGAISSDGAGNLTVAGLNLSTFYTSGGTTGLGFKDQSSNIEFDAVAPSGTARGIVFAGLDTSGTLHQGVKVGPDGVVTMTVYDGALTTTRTVRVFIGTTDPSTYTTINEGDLWIDA